MEYGTDNKFYINLDESTYYVIESDRRSFSATVQPVPMATLLNTVFYHYAPLAVQAWHAPEEPPEKAHHPLRFRIDKPCCVLLTGMDFDGIPVGEPLARPAADITDNELFRQVIRQYAACPYGQRERIFFGEACRRLLEGSACETEKPHRISFTTRPPASAVLQCRLLGIRQDSNPQYNYLVGYFREAGQAWHIGCVRLSNIIPESIRSHKNESGKITQRELADLHRAIAERGIPFLNGECQVIRVAFTEAGLRQYNRVLANRPRMAAPPQQEKGWYLAEFYCTPYQLKVYLYPFGCNAVVLQPEALAAEMKRFYQLAAEAAFPFDDR